MSVTHTAESVIGRHSESRQSCWPLIPGILIVALHLPFVVQHWSNVTRHRPHYEFTPLVFAAFGWLLWNRFPRDERTLSRWTRSIVGLLVTADLILAFGAVVINSPVVGVVAMIVGIGGILIFVCGRAAIRQLLPVWLLLWLVVPPPFRWDLQLIRSLQRITGQTASLLLDRIGIPHVLMGNVFQLPDRELFVAEACSGIHSQLVLLTVACILSVVRQRSIVHAIPLMLSAVFWSVVINTGRVAFVTAAWVAWQIDVATGWPHQFAGHLATVVGFLLLLSTDQLLAGLLAPTIDHDDDEFLLGRARPDALSRWWDHWIAAGNGTAEQREPTRYSQPSGRSKVEPALITPTPPTATATASTTISLAMGALLMLPATCLQTLQLMDTEQAARQIDTVTSAIDADWLPNANRGWQVTGFTRQLRERGSDDGLRSCQWTCRAEAIVARVSIDSPFNGWHELTRCYTARGWSVQQRSIRNVTITATHPGSRSKDTPVVEVDLTKPTGESAFLMFASMDQHGQSVTPRATHWTGLRTRLGNNPLMRRIATRISTANSGRTADTTIQLQQFCTSELPLTVSQKDRLRDLYRQSRTRIESMLHTDTNQE